MESVAEECSFAGCTDPISYKAGALCRGHYKQHRSGKPLTPKRRSLRGEKCDYATCNRDASGQYQWRLCSAHGRQEAKGHPLYSCRDSECDNCPDGTAWRFGLCRECVMLARAGTIENFAIKPNKECDSIGCWRKIGFEARFCPTHNMRKHRGTDIDAPISERYIAPDRECVYPGCHEWAETRTGKMEYCPRHAVLIRRNGSATPSRSRNGAFAGRTCIVLSCKNPAIVSWMCSTCNFRAYKYNLSSIQLCMLLADPACRICGSSDNPHVDHDHKCCDNKDNSPTCGKCTRGLLCGGCNIGLGAFGDDPEKMRAAARYLEATSLG